MKYEADNLLATASQYVSTKGSANQLDASIQTVSQGKIVSTDPPYYDNVPYADLSDFFYVWLRRSLRPIFPDLFTTLAVPKAEELVATPYRHGGKEKAEAFFLEGMTQAMHRLAEQGHPGFPVTIYYAYKQSESDGGEGVTNTGWDTFLEAVIQAGFAITGTWPMRTELGNRMIGSGTNALASSIVIVCRPLTASATMVSRRDFVAALRRELPEALRKLMQGNIAPVDLAQATIGPGMAIYTRYAQVLELDGSRLSVRTALQIINEQLDAILTEEEGGMDRDTRFCLAWFQQFGMEEGAFGQADVMARAKGTAVDGLQSAGVLEANRGKVRLLKRSELPTDWDPAKDARHPLWECTQHLVRALHAGDGGEMAAARLARAMGGTAEEAKALAYRLYTICERKGWAEEALAYNNLVVAWPSIRQQAAELTTETYVQAELNI